MATAIAGVSTARFTRFPAVAQAQRPIWALASGWLLQIPLVYMAVWSKLSFKNVGDNTPSGASGLLASSDGSRGGAIAEQIFISLLLLCFIAPNYRLILRTCMRIRFLFVLMLLPACSMAWSIDVKMTAKASISTFLSILFAVYFAKCLTARRQMQALFMTGWICTLISIVLSIALPRYGIDHRTGRENEWEGLYGGKNICAVSTLFLLMPGFYVELRSRIGKSLRVLYILLLLFMIAMTRSATAALLVPLLLLIVGSLHLATRFAPRQRIVLALCSSIFVAGLLTLFVLNLDIIFGAVGRDITFSGRTIIWKAVSLSILKKPLLGYGYNAYWTGLRGESASVMFAIGRVLSYAHDGFLEVMLSLGVLGLGAVLFLLARSFRNGIFVLQRELTGANKWYICITLYTVLYNIDEGTLMSGLNLVWLLAVVAFVQLEDRVSTLQRRTRFREHSAREAPLSAGALPAAGIAS